MYTRLVKAGFQTMQVTVERNNGSDSFYLDPQVSGYLPDEQNVQSILQELNQHGGISGEELGYPHSVSGDNSRMEIYIYDIDRKSVLATIEVEPL